MGTDPAKEAIYNERTVVLRDTIRDVKIKAPHNNEPLTISYSRLETPDLVKQASCGVI